MLDDDVAARIDAESRSSDAPVTTVVNEALREGLEQLARGSRTPFRVHARPMGPRPDTDPGDVEGLLDRLEGPDRR